MRDFKHKRGVHVGKGLKSVALWHDAVGYNQNDLKDDEQVR
jgi:hypothetical protein